jgi:hypothetical protein
MSAERCNCGTHTKAACDIAGACGQGAAHLPAAPTPTEQPITREWCERMAKLEAGYDGNIEAGAAPLPAEQAGELPPLPAEHCELLNNLYGTAPIPAEIEQPFAGIIVLLETFAEIGMVAKRDGNPTPNSLLCLRFAAELRAALAARQAPTEQTGTIDTPEFMELLGEYGFAVAVNDKPLADTVRDGIVVYIDQWHNAALAARQVGAPDAELAAVNAGVDAAMDTLNAHRHERLERRLANVPVETERRGGGDRRDSASK